MRPTTLITGAGGGIGRATVRALAQQSSEPIIATDLTLDHLQSLQDLPNVFTYPTDVNAPQSIQALKVFTQAQGLQVRTLINNAGIIDFFPLSEASEAQLQHIFGINTLGPIRLISAFLPDLIASRGRVIQITSESSKLMAPFQPYNASKKALDACSETMRGELQLKGIQLINIRAGAVKTALFDAMNDTQLQKENSVYKAEFEGVKKMLQAIEIKTTTPEKIAQLILRIQQTKNPKQTYRINNNMLIGLLQYLGEWLRTRLFTWQIKKNMD